MSTRDHSDDPELRALLDSIGITENESMAEDLTDAESEQAAQMLARIIGETQTSKTAMPSPKTASHRWHWPDRTLRLSLTASVALCVLVGFMIVVQPWSGTPTASAQTPAMLRFAEVRSGQIETVGAPARDLLHQLATRAAAQPEPADLPVQHVELDGWWASSAPPDEKHDKARTVLVPVQSSAYLLPNGDRRAIEHRGAPLDADGRLSTIGLDWDNASRIADTIAPMDEEQDVDYIQTLPTDIEKLREVLAPEEACAQTRGGCLLSGVASLFETYVVPPDVTARLWTTLATETTITTLGDTTDRRGRHAVALTALSMNPEEQFVILIDPQSGHYLGSETVLIKPSLNLGFDPPAVITFTYLIKADRISEYDVPDDSTATRY